MIQRPHLSQTAISSQFAPVYRSDLARTIGVLQQLQVLCAAQGDTSLADVVQAVRDMQHTFGEHCHLEEVIQRLIGQHLSQQLTTRRLTQQQQYSIEAVEVLL